MNQQTLDSIPAENRKHLAVAYLIRNESERPAETVELFKKLMTAETAAAETNKAIRITEESLNELGAKFNQAIGSLQTITELIGDLLPEEKVLEWCAKYEPPNKMPPMPSIPGNKRIVTPGDVDMAGITTK